MTDQVHIAAQYLATAGISFLERKEDDSHTNLGFSVENGILSTRPLADSGEVLSLNYTNFSLEWMGQNSNTTLKLNGKSHQDVLNWIKHRVTDSKIEKPYVYKYHYDLPYHITSEFRFQSDPIRLQELLDLRILANSVIKSFLKNHKLSSEVRIWPHHFDTGAFVQLDDETSQAIGLGLATPDSMVDDYYFYISGYYGHNPQDTSNFNHLTQGKWHNNGFKGAVLPTTGVKESAANLFLAEAFKAYQKS